MREKINLLGGDNINFRDIPEGWRTLENRLIAKKFGKEFFDGDRVNGYGGYKYDGRWRNVAQKLVDVYDFKKNDSCLDIGCAKGFFIYDLNKIRPRACVRGIDISTYAINNAMDGYANWLNKEYGLNLNIAKRREDRARERASFNMDIGGADNLPYDDDSFDVVLAINTLHNLDYNSCLQAVKEMVRVCSGDRMFIHVDSYENERQKRGINNWNLTAKIILTPDRWLEMFDKANYKGDYFWNLIEHKN